MTPEDVALISRVFNENKPLQLQAVDQRDMWYTLVFAFSDAFSAIHPRFNSDYFLKVCGVNQAVHLGEHHVDISPPKE